MCWWVRDRQQLHCTDWVKIRPYGYLCACTPIACRCVCLQVEVKNTQKYNFDRGHSVWRRLLLPHGDLQLSVLTRLSLSGDHKVSTQPS